jgi:hypothetical protein
VRFAVLVLVVALAAGCSGKGGDRAELSKSDLPQLVLQQRDLPGLPRYDAGPPTAFDNPSGPRADPKRFGRIGGWRVLYKVSGRPTGRAVLLAHSRVDAFASTEGAHKDFDAYRLELPHDGSFDPRPLGEESRATSHLQPGTPAIRYYTFVWRDRAVTASLMLAGRDDRLTRPRAAAYARLQQRRIAAAVRG